ncbi:MAG: hypothetical protein JXA30_02280, partial [Deltaproteobacteria bacterium]|nr:hypothetical protein [Deltaproteobacteria bacterium]
PARGRKPVLRDELAAVVVKQQYPPERLRSIHSLGAKLSRLAVTEAIRHVDLPSIDCSIYSV